MKNKIIDFLKSSQFKAFAWQTTNGFLVLLIGLVTTIQPDVVSPAGVLIVAMALALLNAITKFININFL